ncbi:hypothetical protein [Elioraea sp.]|uniref:hypothetical protein n=1 Tax=Elioraea sp. TaxID=2185103 RepID=UPI0021DDA388|nr:hypothetical protein [Elioraea sp.]GIX10341.1 MAG: hypothetical protein KatS3mg116_2051 [Elioraea sp.]
MSEAEVLRAILSALGARPDMRVFRNHVGAGWTGRLVARTARRIVLEDARHCTFGLAPGSPDLIGWRSLIVTPEMVGRRIARFVAIEAKARGRLTAGQNGFLAVAGGMGAIAGVARSAEDARALIEPSP